MEFIFSIKNHYFEKGTPWVELDKIKQRSWFLSVDIEDDEDVPCYDTEYELRISKGISFKSVQILTRKTQETHPFWECMLDMSYLYSYELREVTFKNLPDQSGMYSMKVWFDDDGINFGDFKKLCEFRHKWDDGLVCSKCGVRKADWVEADIKAKMNEEGVNMKWVETTDKNNPLSCRGEYCCDIPWLQHSTNGGMAYYSVRKDFSGLWEPMFWHGNRGHSVGKPSKTEIEAKVKCLEHLKRMYAGFSVQIGKILRSYINYSS